MRKRNKKEKGLQAEINAIKYLKNKGFEVSGKNYRTKYGEIDIICVKDGILVFVEVRSSDIFSPIESIRERKIKKILEVSKIFLSENQDLVNKMEIEGFRFDVIIFEKGKIFHIEDAFRA